jgi:class 3 adenylate cyclase
VLFADVVGFTSYCNSHPVDLVVTHLQDLVAEFEAIAERHGLEKIKTIGDAFMATAGLLKYTPEPVQAAARCGLEMAETAPRLSAGWNVRVGIHLGPVVAGIIGRQQYLFDVWGDTVNIASRIVQQAEPGAVLLSGFAWLQLGKKATGVWRGIADLKGKGATELVECREVRAD